MSIEQKKAKITPEEKEDAKKRIGELYEELNKGSLDEFKNLSKEDSDRIRQKFFTPLGDRSTD